MKKKVLWVAVALMIAIGFGACSSDDNDEPLSNENNERKDIALTRAEQTLVNSNNDFAFNLFRMVNMSSNSAQTEPDMGILPGGCVINGEWDTKSKIVSPISITYALGMLNNGAAGETEAEINKVLGFGETGADGINAFCRKMLTDAPKLDKLTKVMIANTIYMNKGYELKPDFVSKANTFYDATPETRDFQDGKTLSVINKWGSDHTEGMIPEVITADEFNPDAVSYLLNAIYFKGTWAEKFDKGNTQNETFKGYDGNKQVPMMHQEHEFNYTESDDCQALRLPYGNKAYSMTILLPKEGKTIYDVLNSLTAENWQQQYQKMRNAKVDVKLPRFETQSDVDLSKIMSALGMPRAFDDALAEFPDFCNAPTYIELMKQVARIKLNEEGTEAAAVTVVEMGNKAHPVGNAVFHATRPFLYVISEQSTGAIFFIGQYMGN